MRLLVLCVFSLAVLVVFGGINLGRATFYFRHRHGGVPLFIKLQLTSKHILNRGTLLQYNYNKNN